MALELIQNADDAKAEEIIFDITDRGLYVTNDGVFTYCGDLNARPCEFLQSRKEPCDYHRIADVGSGGKLSEGENIGRFGIGFVSTYQITDHPEIRSAGIKLTLVPEEGQWFIDQYDQPCGTSFFLPWASDPNTKTRLELNVSHVSAAHIDQLAKDFQRVLRNGLLFLRHVQKAEVRRNGELLHACDLMRNDSSELIVSYRPGSEVEHWYVLQADAKDIAEQLCVTHPRLITLDRSTRISIGMRIDPEPLSDGMLYAFLPSEQPTGLPVHINADFFPEPDRKAMIFGGHQHEQAWNEMLIDVAATELARDPEGLLRMLGHVPFWNILERAFRMASPANQPDCFSKFWDRLKITSARSLISIAQDGTPQIPEDVFLPRTILESSQEKVLLELGGCTVGEVLRPYHTVMNQLGAKILTLDRMVDLISKSFENQAAGKDQVSEERIDNFYIPLWEIVSDLLPGDELKNPTANSSIKKLMNIPFIVTEDLFIVTTEQSHLVSVPLDVAKVAFILPRFAIASHHLLGFPKIARLISPLELGAVVFRINLMCASDPLEDVIHVESEALRDLYSLFSELDRRGNVDNLVYQTLRNLPIWLSGRGLNNATQVLLPGDFKDPTGLSDLLDVSVLTDSARDFVSSKLGVQTQTIGAFVLTVLPRFFNDNGPLEEKKYTLLITELGNHPTLVNDETIRVFLSSLPLIPTQDGSWSRPTKTYRRTENLVKILGEASHLWLDTARIPNTRSVQNFIDSLGILRSPIARHLADRMLDIAQKYLPSDDARRFSGEAFYVLCDKYEEWKDKKSFHDVIDDLRCAECFPAAGDLEKWHSSGSLYAPYRAEAFSSQAKILDFRNTVRLKTDLLEKLRVAINPETNLVINHLQHCFEKGVEPHVSTYQFLNERAQREDNLIKTLAGWRCIYVKSQKIFVRPNQLYWSPQQLGSYAFTIPGNLMQFKPFFDAIGVKNSPEGRDFIDIIMDIVREHHEQSKPIIGKEREVYDACLAGIAVADEQQTLELLDLRRIREAPTILNLRDHLTYPDEILLRDSEWHAGFFGGELDPALCKPPPEYWPLLEKVGVKKLSESAEVELEFVDGQETIEAPLVDKLVERVEILARLLHDKPTTVNLKISKALSELEAVSYDLVRIQASVNLGGNLVSAPPRSVHAFFDIDNHRLVLARPVGDRSWPHILNAIFHQLMPEESGSEISKLTLSIRPLMSMPVEEAHQELTAAGIPSLEPVNRESPADLTSPELDDFGTAQESESEQATTADMAPTESMGEDMPPRDRKIDHELDDRRTASGEATHDKTTDSTRRGHSESTEPGGRPHSSEAGSPGVPTGGQTGARHHDRTQDKKPVSKRRAKHKEQWDRRLLSYVRKKGEDSANQQEGDGTANEHNLAVEVIARNAVCEFEKRHGRVAEQMAQTNPGFDIISRNPSTGEERFIEVKGVNGEWNQTGVGLSRTQFSNAQDKGDTYWLYVVEFASDPTHMRVHPIRSPALQVTSFMYDSNWRQAVTEENEDPALAYYVGARVKHQHFGLGWIKSVQLRGSMRVMLIDFDEGGRQMVALNLQIMEVVEDDYGNNGS
jgi:hypothetical protein